MKIKVRKHSISICNEGAWYVRCPQEFCIWNADFAHIEFFSTWKQAFKYALKHAEEIRAENKPEHYNNVHRSMGFGEFLAQAHIEQQRRER